MINKGLPVVVRLKLIIYYFENEEQDGVFLGMEHSNVSKVESEVQCSDHLLHEVKLKARARAYGKPTDALPN